MRMRKEILLRVGFLVALGGVLLVWAQWRKPRELVVQIDLTAVLPGEINEIDVVVRRDGHALARHDVKYGKVGAPGLIEIPVHAAPGEAEVETTLVYAGKPALRDVTRISLTSDSPGRIGVH